MYGLRGERRLTEWEVPGYRAMSCPNPCGSEMPPPPRLQLDILGEVLDAFHQGRNGKLAVDKVAWAVQGALLVHLEKLGSARRRNLGDS